MRKDIFFVQILIMILMAFFFFYCLYLLSPCVMMNMTTDVYCLTVW